MMKSIFRALLVSVALFCSVLALNAQCDTPEPIPYSIDFDDGQTGVNAFPDCWTKVLPANNFPYPMDYQGSYCMAFKGGCCAALPTLAAPVNTLRITFDVTMANTTNALIVGVMETPDISELEFLEPIDTITVSTVNTYFPVEVHFNHYTGTGGYIVLLNEGNAYTRIDNLVVSLIPNCLNPVSVAAGNVTSQSATLSWTEMGTATQWQAISSTTPVTDFSSLTPMTLNSTSYSATNLTANTTYYFYVRSICGNEYSEWVGTSFTTLCGISALPLSEEFAANTLPACWEFQQVSGVSAVSFVSSGIYPTCAPFSGNYMVQWGSYSYPTGRQGRLVMPEVSVSGSDALNVNFMWFHSPEVPTSTTEGVLVQYSYDGENWLSAAQGLVPRYSSVNSGWTEYNVVLPLESGHSTAYVGFLFTSGGGRNCYLDEVNLSAASGCFAPANLTVSDIAGNSATASWVEVGSANSWQVVLSEFPVSDFSGMNPISVSTTSYNLTNLNPITSYYLYVRSVCAPNEYSEWSVGASFTTSCGTIMSLPYTESFDDYGVGNNAFPTCWTRPSTSYYMSQMTPSAIDISSYDGNNSLIFCTGSNMKSYAITPAIAEDIHQVAVTFFLYKENVQYSGTIEVGVMSNASDYATFESVAVFDLQQPETWTFCSVNFDSTALTGGNRHIAFRHNSVSDLNYYLMDEVQVLHRTDCWPAYHLEVSGVTGNTASFSWIDVNENSSWQLKISEIPLADPSGYANVLDTIIPATSFNINYLNGNTTYYYYLRSVCSENEFGFWQGGSFTTDVCNCFIRIYMHDSYGDGWNGAKIQMQRGSTLIAEFSLADGHNDTAMIYTCEAGNITCTYFSSDDPYLNAEVSFEIENQDGMQVYATTGTPTVGVFLDYAPACGVACDQVPATVNAVALAGGGASVSWTPVPEAQSYALYRNGTLVAEYIPATSYTDPVTVPGENCYTVAASCIVGESSQSAATCVVGINEFDENQRVAVYPNPAHNSVTVSAGFAFEKISIFNMIGQELGTWKVASTQTAQIALDCTPGLYLLKIYSGNKCSTAKVIVQ